MGEEHRLSPAIAGATSTQRAVWIASYPKSGNTWVRIFLSHVLAGGSAAINDLPVRLHAASRSAFDATTGIDSSDLTEDEAASIRPQVYRRLSVTLDPPVFFKTHDAYGDTPAGEPLFPSDITACAIYIVRNPLDVAVSYAHHDAVSLDRIVARLADDGFSVAGQGSIHLRQYIGSWSSHVCSWMSAPLPLEIVRYEDLLTHGLPAFARLARRTGMPDSPDLIGRAMEASSFDRLQRDEALHGFAESPDGVAPFFRSGVAGGWRSALSRPQVDRIVNDHATVMTRFGYLSRDGTPV